MKKGQITPVVIFLVIIIVGIGGFLIYNNDKVQTSPITGNVVGVGETNQENCREVQVPYTEEEIYYETVPYTDQECEYKELSFKSSDDTPQRRVDCAESHDECKESHKNFWGNVVCDRMETVCDTYAESVSFDITNLDSEKGNWIYEWKVSCKSNQPLCTGETETIVTYSVELDPTETKTQYYSISYDAKGQKILYPYIKNKPTKQVCRDVIKNREVEKTRTVTKYKPETKCD
ncbi:hypothetical protein J4462_03670 [Candidatus Pacearchaeota archaeon]|nr:hypothetical protein [Candidatus Pacearchaeota archaeon]